ncbi:MAG: O-antigen ligase family protein [Gaiellaceae bacterium]
MTPRRALELVLPLTIAGTVFAFTCGSSAVIPVLRVGRPLRWICLVTLCGLALLHLVLERPRPVRPPAWLLGLAALAGLGALSAVWSVDPRLTLGRAGSLALLFLTAAALGIAGASRPETARRVLLGIVAGVVAVAVAGLVVLAVLYDEAVQSASSQYPWRYRGLGENPNTVALLLGVTLPLAGWLVLAARTRRARVAGIAVFGLLDGSLVASGSRGALLAAFPALLVLVLLAGGPARRRSWLAAAVAVLALANLGVQQLPSPSPGGEPSRPAFSRDASLSLPLEAEIGRGGPGGRPPAIRRKLLGGSGRGQAWPAAVGQALERPVAGYGFGTEAEVFVDRFYFFASALPENSYIGLLLQLGVAGLIAFLAAAAALLGAARRSLREAPQAERLTLAAATSVAVAALLGGVTQSYLLSVGNVATSSVWICAFLAASASLARRSNARAA